MPAEGGGSYRERGRCRQLRTRQTAFRVTFRGTKDHRPSLPAGHWFQDLCRYQNPWMLKSFIENGVVQSALCSRGCRTCGHRTRGYRGPTAEAKIVHITSPTLNIHLETKLLCQYEDEGRDIPGGPVVRTPSFHCREHGFDPWSGN